ncbi:unnamed protein product [Tuber aestivum]|uniref:RNase H type-1 domain-containing protein n=1 Tax=Tuber aestivum TaxID=59557 RepID=A0A292PJE3_9PEZI|nr:unnamed protein product [Tuber aestivum]
MDPKAVGHRRPSTTVSEMKEVVPGARRRILAAPCESHHGHCIPNNDISTIPSGFSQGTFHNYPEEDKIATNIYSTLPPPYSHQLAPNPESWQRLLQISQNIYRTTPNGVRVKFADGSTQLQFPRRLYSSDISGLARREKMSLRKCTRYSASMQVTIALFRTPIRYPQGGHPTHDNVHSSPPNAKLHQGRNTLIVQCAVLAPMGGGIYFGPDSRFNRYHNQGKPSKNGLLGAELETVKHSIIVAQDIATKLSKAIRSANFTKIVIATPSEMLVRGMTEFLSHWRRMNWRGLDALFFPGVEVNKQRWEALDQIIGQAMEDGLEVDLWLVPEEEVSGATDLIREWRGSLASKVQNPPKGTRESTLVSKEGSENLEK